MYYCAARRSAVEGEQDLRESGALCSPPRFYYEDPGLGGGRSQALKLNGKIC